MRRVSFHCNDPQAVVHYRFGLSTADFVLCSRCGVYLGAVLATGDGAFSATNVNALTTEVGQLREPLQIHYEDENEHARIERRRRGWTSVTDKF